MTVSARPPTANEVQVARDNVVAWLNFYLRHHPDEFPSKAALARRLGVAKSALTPLFAKGSRRAPSFKLLLGAARLVSGVDNLLRPPPTI
jgi:hypothetical protein